jgi:molybdopterin-guanine dinucleotide biosynthesis protein A
MKSGAIILCGGQSSRMGRAKALLPWRGRTMIEHVVATLQQCVSEIVVVTSGDVPLPSLPAKIVRDREPDLGPLGGIREGLEALDADLAFATSTDAPFLSSAFVKCMLAFGRAAAPDVDGFVQTLAAAYPKTLASTANELIAKKRMSLHELLEAADFRRVRADELPELHSIRGFNTPEEYLAAVQTDGPTESVHIELLGAARARTGIEGLDIAIGSLQEVLEALAGSVPALKLLENGALSPRFQAVVHGQRFRDGCIPIGPGDRLQIKDA